jgi:acetyl-CoA C-acetyltransferase
MEPAQDRAGKRLWTVAVQEAHRETRCRSGMSATYKTIDPRTPIVIGVGQTAERVDDADYQGLSPIDLAVSAARAAADDTGVDAQTVIDAIDIIACTRQFEDSTPGAPAPLGKSTKYPLSVANRLGAAPRRAVLEVAGGQSPQHLVTEFSKKILAGHTEAVLIAGAEAISTIRHLAKSDNKPDFADDPADPDGIYEDRGFGLSGLTTMEQAAHGLVTAPGQYALLENARRAACGNSRDKYAATMGALFAPFTKVAAGNPFSAAPEEHDAAELITVTDRNRMIADPYTRFLVARDSASTNASGCSSMVRLTFGNETYLTVRSSPRRRARWLQSATHWRSQGSNSTTSNSSTSTRVSLSQYRTLLSRWDCHPMIRAG